MWIHLLVLDLIDGAGGTPIPPPVPGPTPGAGKGRGGRRRRFQYADGREIDIVSDAHFERIIKEVTRAKLKASELPTPKRVKGQKKPVKIPVPQIDPFIILEMLEAMNQMALTEQAILHALDEYARLQDEDDLLLLLCYI